MFFKENLKLKNDIENFNLIKLEFESKINRLVAMKEQNSILNEKSNKAQDLEQLNLIKKTELLELEKTRVQGRIT